jgi:hypothetical protein
VCQEQPEEARAACSTLDALGLRVTNGVVIGPWQVAEFVRIPKGGVRGRKTYVVRNFLHLTFSP